MDRQQLEGREEIHHHQIAVVDMVDNQFVEDKWDMVDKVVKVLHMGAAVGTHHAELGVLMIVDFVVDVVVDVLPHRVVAMRNHSKRAFLPVVEPDYLRRYVVAAVVVVVSDFVVAHQNHSNPVLEDCKLVVVVVADSKLVDYKVVVVDSKLVLEDYKVVVVVDYKDYLVQMDINLEHVDCKPVVLHNKYIKSVI